MKRIRIFISSPGDVIEERNISRQVINRLQERLHGRLELEAFFWEDEPVLATATFQTQFPRAAHVDVFVCMLWSRIGTPLPEGATFQDGSPIHRADGSLYESGTVAEFEDALVAYESQGSPAMMMYFKRAPVHIDPHGEDAQMRMEQLKGVDQFFNKWFKDAQGRYPRGHSEFSSLTEFAEKLETHLCKLLAERFLEKDAYSRQICRTHWQGSPFRGLDVFNEEHASIFFGRNQSIDEIYTGLREQAMRHRAFVMILGLSGSGKSSLVRAGILPLLKKMNIPCVSFRPSDASGSLVQAVENLLNTVLDYLPKLAQSPALAPPTISTKNTELVLPRAALFIDQFEELFTLETLDSKKRTDFMSLISNLAQSGQIWVLATMRSEFLPQTSEYPVLATLLENKGRYLLLPPTPSELHQIIREPALAAGLSFEHPSQHAPLDEAIFDEIANQSTSLALLEFTLEALYQRRNKDNTLTYQAYRDIGGVTGALAQHAEQVFSHLSAEEQLDLRRLVRGLVRVGHSSTMLFTAQRTPLSLLTHNKTQRHLIEKLTTARLLVTDKDDRGQAVVRLIHEALLQHWPTLQRWLIEDREWLQVRSRISDNAEHWLAEKELPDLLLADGKPLMDARYLLSQWEEILAPHEVKYIQSSEQHAQRLQQVEQDRITKKHKRARQLIFLFAMINVLLIGVGIYAYEQADYATQQSEKAEISRQKAVSSAKIARKQERQAEQQKRKTWRTQSLFLADLARQQNKKSHFATAALLALEGLPSRIHPDWPVVAQVALQLYRAMISQRERMVFTEQNKAVIDVAVSSNNQWLATASLDNTVIIRAIKDGKILHTLSLGDESILSILAFSPNNLYLATATYEGQVRLWDVKTGRTLHYLLGNQDTINDLSFSPDSRLLAAATGNEYAQQDSSIKLWNIPSGTLAKTLQGHTNKVVSVEFSPEGTHLLSASLDSTAKIWTIPQGKPYAVLKGHQNELTNAVFSSDGYWMATASADHTARLWVRQKGQLAATLTGHTQSIQDIAFSADSQRIATASLDGTVRLWDVYSSELLNVLRGHDNEIYSVDFSQDGLRLVSAGNDRSARIWDAYNGTPLAVLNGHADRINRALFSPDGRTVVTISGSGSGSYWRKAENSTRLWRTYSPHLLLQLNHHEESVNDVLFAPDGKTIFSASGRFWDSADNSLRIWDANTGKQRLFMSDFDEQLKRLRISKDGKTLITLSGNSHEDALEANSKIQVWHISPDAQHPQLSLKYSIETQNITYADNENDRAYLYLAKQSPRIEIENQYRHQGLIYDVLFSPNEKWILSLGKDQTARLWHAETGKPTSILSGHEGDVIHASFHPNNTLIATASNSGIHLWSMNQQGEVHPSLIMGSHNGAVKYVRFSPDGAILLSLHTDNTARLWDSQDGTLRATLVGHKDTINDAAFSPNGEFVLTGSGSANSWGNEQDIDNTARLWNIGNIKNTRSPLKLKPIKILRGHAGSVEKVRFNPDGTLLLTVSIDNSMRLWAKNTGKLLTRFQGHKGQITQARFNADGSRLVSSDSANNIRVWPIFGATQVLIDYAKTHKPRELSPEQRQAFFLE